MKNSLTKIDNFVYHFKNCTFVLYQFFYEQRQHGATHRPFIQKVR